MGMRSVDVRLLVPRGNGFDRDDGGQARRHVDARAETFVVHETWAESEDGGLETGESYASVSLPPSRSYSDKE